MAPPTTLGAFLGRFHPLLLHFPIVLAVLPLIYEVADRLNVVKKHSRAIGLIWILAACSTLAVIAVGYLLYASGEYEGKLIASHFRLGVLAGVSILATSAVFFLLEQNQKLYPLYLSCLVATNGVLGYASHMGGSVTHGENYLTENLPALLTDHTAQAKPIEDMLFYEDLIAPIIDTRCASCHNTHKKKGKYLMTQYDQLLEGGESGQTAIVPHQSDKSELFHRITLPQDHKDRMPPEGKTPLSDSEVELIRYWIDTGADQKQKIVDAQQDETIRQTLDSYLPTAVQLQQKVATTKAEQTEIHRALQELARELQVTIRRDKEAEGFFYSLAMQFPPAPFGGEELKKLSPYFSLFTGASLVASQVTDDDLYQLGKMTNLRKLYLQKTAIKGSGLVYLQPLKNLHTLNLSFTQLSNSHALNLLLLPSLQNVYVFGNELSEDVLEALRHNQPDKKFLLEEGPYN